MEQNAEPRVHPCLRTQQDFNLTNGCTLTEQVRRLRERYGYQADDIADQEGQQAQEPQAGQHPQAGQQETQDPQTGDFDGQPMLEEQQGVDEVLDQLWNSDNLEEGGNGQFMAALGWGLGLHNRVCLVLI